MSNPMVERLRDDPASLQPIGWSVTYTWLFALQSWLLIILAAILAPQLISRDHAAKAHLQYFHRPVRIRDYLLGKGGVIVGFGMLVTAVPGLLLVPMMAYFAPDWGAVATNVLPVVAAMLAAAVVMVVPVAIVAMVLASWTANGRVATGLIVAWVGLGEIAYTTVRASVDATYETGWLVVLSLRQLIVSGAVEVIGAPARIEALGNLGATGDLRRSLTNDNDGQLALFVLAAITLLGIAFLARTIRRRVQA